MSAIFGPAGTSIDFKELGYKNSLDIPKFTKKYKANRSFKQ
jgi:hypothetical protein